MKVKFDFSTLSIWHVIASWIPFKSKRYISKWAKIRKDWIGSIHLGCSNDSLRVHIIWKPNFMIDHVPNPFVVTRGISMRDLWDNLLVEIAEVENMRNADELKIWLDTQVV